jgi:hypothetical protein
MATAAKPQNITPDQKSFGARILMRALMALRCNVRIKSAAASCVNGTDRVTLSRRAQCYVKQCFRSSRENGDPALGPGFPLSRE